MPKIENKKEIEKISKRIAKKEIKNQYSKFKKDLLKEKELEILIQDLVKEMLQKYHDMFYRDKSIIKQKLK